ncbi:MAG: nucleotidyltransferase domain-containing protein [Bacteroidota bacterium]
MSTTFLKHPILSQFAAKMETLYQDKLERILLFGSQARGDAAEDSDIDLLLLLNQEEVNPYREVPKITDVVFEINIKYNQLLFYLPMSLKRWENEQSFFIDNVKREGITIWTKEWKKC